MASISIPFSNTYRRLPANFFEVVLPEKVPDPHLIAFNHELAQALGIYCKEINELELAQVFSGNLLLAGTEPIALAYAGHQFAHFVPQLGDGRAVLLGEVKTDSGKQYDIQLKGSGRTPFSRGGDGKSPIGPVLREYLVSEFMHRVGVPTTRALAAVASGEDVYREVPLPGAVFTRVAESHVRVGTFEYFASRKDSESLKKLLQYVISRHYSHLDVKASSSMEFFQEVVKRQADLVAQWLSLGFIHGVMNTDNTSVVGITIDYGPCAFMDQFRAAQVYSFIDRYGRYAYDQQSKVLQWNLARLADTLLLLSEHPDQEVAEYENILLELPELIERKRVFIFSKKLGIEKYQDSDKKLIGDWLAYLQKEGIDFTLSFRQLAQKLLFEEVGILKPTRELDQFFHQWKERVSEANPNLMAIKERMDAVNPLLIPRNHQIEKSIAAAESGDYSHFHRLRKALAEPYLDDPEYQDLQKPPQPHECISNTFCGT